MWPLARLAKLRRCLINAEALLISLNRFQHYHHRKSSKNHPHQHRYINACKCACELKTKDWKDSHSAYLNHRAGKIRCCEKTWSLLLIRNSDSESTFSTTLLRVVKYPFFSTTPLSLSSWQNIQMQETIKTSAFQDCFRGNSCFEIKILIQKSFKNMPYLPFWNWTLVGWICCQT